MFRPLYTPYRIYKKLENKSQNTCEYFFLTYSTEDFNINLNSNPVQWFIVCLLIQSIISEGVRWLKHKSMIWHLWHFLVANQV